MLTSSQLGSGSFPQRSVDHIRRRLPVGADVLTGGGVHFRVWAPQASKLAVLIETGSGHSAELEKEADGYWSATVGEARAGDLYRFRINEGDPVPDPASRFQPDGPMGPSMVIDPGLFQWNDRDWKGIRIEGQVLYEMHVGTFTREGTWRAAARELPALKDLGITAIEMMPVNDFSGRFGWGYDGVDFFAPTRLYGNPDDLRAFIDQAHQLGIGLILDVVYNHAGPSGNYLNQFSEDYFSSRFSTDWGATFNFSGPNSPPVREFFTANAAYWIQEFHFDGLRLDATQNIYDTSERHILAEITDRVHHAGGDRETIVVAENEPQDTRLLLAQEKNGFGMDAVWNDDFHHSAVAALTGHNEAYYRDYRGRGPEFIAAAKWGYLYQGQHYRWQHKRRGRPGFGIPPARFINYLENHDQIANLGFGLRVHQMSHPGMYRAVTGVLLLCSQTPLLFQGQEFGATTRFVFFADHDEALNALVREGRVEFLSQFPSLSYEHSRVRIPDPTLKETFESCKLNFAEREAHRTAYDLHRDLIKLRRSDPVLSAQRPGGTDGANLDMDSFVLRFFGAAEGDDRLLIVNLGIDQFFSPVPEPLLAPPVNCEWRSFWSSEDPRYGGGGALPIETSESWFIPGRATFLLKPDEA
ncbi:MAG TPA: malto-oligosyltrehalose trehalohydrolase [Candidatus Binatia bacterium]|jgi:maltooligosyltrehalose trehalohydrolase